MEELVFFYLLYTAGYVRYITDITVPHQSVTRFTSRLPTKMCYTILHVSTQTTCGWCCLVDSVVVNSSLLITLQNIYNSLTQGKHFFQEKIKPINLLLLVIIFTVNMLTFSKVSNSVLIFLWVLLTGFMWVVLVNVGNVIMNELLCHCHSNQTKTKLYPPQSWWSSLSAFLNVRFLMNHSDNVFINVISWIFNIA